MTRERVSKCVRLSKTGEQNLNYPSISSHLTCLAEYTHLEAHRYSLLGMSCLRSIGVAAGFGRVSMDCERVEPDPSKARCVARM